MDNIFSLTFVAIAQLITLLESFIDSKGINISNWVTQIIGNNPVGYAFTLKATMKDKKPFGVKVEKNFSPVGGHRDCPTYLGLMRNSQFDNPQTELLSMVGYILCGLILGKLPAIVNSGRGLILERVFKELNLVDLTLVIHEYSSGGKDLPHDIDYTFPEIKSLVKFFCVRGERIKALPKREGHTSADSKLDTTKRAKVVQID